MTRSPHLLTVTEAARFAGVSRASILGWHRSGKLMHAAVISGRPCFARGALLALTTGICPVCASTFKKRNLRQVFCPGKSCRQKAHRYAKQAAGPRTRTRTRADRVQPDEDQAAESAVPPVLQLPAKPRSKKLSVPKTEQLKLFG